MLNPVLLNWPIKVTLHKANIGIIHISSEHGIRSARRRGCIRVIVYGKRVLNKKSELKKFKNTIVKKIRSTELETLTAEGPVGVFSV